MQGAASLIAGVWLLVRLRTRGQDRSSLIDAAIVAIGLGLLSWTFLIAPYADDTALSPLQRLVSVRTIGYSAREHQRPGRVSCLRRSVSVHVLLL